MNTSDLESILRAALHRIAPDIDTGEIERDEDLREAFDIDSIDFLNLVLALGKQLEIEIPEADYPQMESYNSLISYLEKACCATPWRG